MIEKRLHEIIDNPHQHKDKLIGVGLTYTQGGLHFSLWGNTQAPDKVEAIMINVPIPEGSLTYQQSVLKEALERKGIKPFLTGFDDRFYLEKSYILNELPFLSQIPWLNDLHRSAATKYFVEHVSSTFRKEELIHKSRLSIIFHKDFKTIEQRLEEQTFMLSKVKNGRDIKFNTDTSCGSAFAVQVKGNIYFVTAAHVVEGLEDKSIELTNPVSTAIYCKVGAKGSFDVQLLDMSGQNYQGPTFSLGSLEKSELADTVYVCGYPGRLGQKPTISVGHISKINAEYSGDQGLIQISSAAVNPQNSGGPVTDYLGNVIGVLVMRPTQAERLQNVAFVEPLERAFKEFGII